MKVKIDLKEFDNFIFDNNLFDITKKNLIKYLKNYWYDDEIGFIDDMYSNLETVLKKYNFLNDGYSFNKSYSYNPPLDYISVWIYIYDENNSYVCMYKAFYDYNLELIDDKLST